jgi:disulfide bond formation protein DsbB
MIFLTRFKFIRLLGFIAQSAFAIALFLKCRELYRVEVGLQEAGCLFNAGLPSWFDLEAWLPSIFEVRSACGDSPELLFNITMAEALYIGSAISMTGAVLLLIFSLFSLIKTR